MAIFLSAKTPAGVITYTWQAPLMDGDTLTGLTFVETGITVNADDLDGSTAIFLLADGTVGTTGSIAITATTSAGETLSETIYIPIIGPGVLAETVEDIVSFALRKVTGIGEAPDADQAADALERLQDMLDYWRLTGADVGAPSPLALTSVIYCPDGYLIAIKNNLILQLADMYGAQVSPAVAQNARAGLAMVKARNLPDERPGVYY
jgi:hypothetical protein